MACQSSRSWAVQLGKLCSDEPRGEFRCRRDCVRFVGSGKLPSTCRRPRQRRCPPAARARPSADGLGLGRARSSLPVLR